MKRPLRKKEREREKENYASPFLGPLQEAIVSICPTLTFERISDYTGKRSRHMWLKRETSTGVFGTALLICQCFSNQSRVEVKRHWTNKVVRDTRAEMYYVFFFVTYCLLPVLVKYSRFGTPARLIYMDTSRKAGCTSYSDLLCNWLIVLLPVQNMLF